jgi:hypothetical protein
MQANSADGDGKATAGWSPPEKRSLAPTFFHGKTGVVSFQDPKEVAQMRWLGLINCCGFGLDVIGSGTALPESHA